MKVYKTSKEIEMNLNLKTVAVFTTNVAVTLTVSNAINVAIQNRYPELFAMQSDEPAKVKALKIAKVVGIGIGSAIVANFIGGCAANLVNMALTPNQIETQS
jgi:hypothetical protein